MKYNLSVTFLLSLFFIDLPREKTSERICTISGSKRMKSGKDVPSGGIVKKFSPQLPLAPNSENFALQKPFFAENTYKSWRKRHQNSYLNKKQLMENLNAAHCLLLAAKV